MVVAAWRPAGLESLCAEETSHHTETFFAGGIGEFLFFPPKGSLWSPTSLRAISVQPTEFATPASLLEKVRSLEDQPAWEAFHGRYHHLLVRFALGCGLAMHDAEDVAQEAMVALTQIMPEYDYDPQRCKFRSFVRRLAWARIVDRWRREESSRNRSRAWVDCIQNGGAHPDDRWQNEWERFVLTRALDLLAERRRLQNNVRSLLIELYVRRRSTADASARLDISPEDIHRIRSRWRKPLAEAVAQVRRDLEDR